MKKPISLLVSLLVDIDNDLFIKFISTQKLKKLREDEFNDFKVVLF